MPTLGLFTERFSGRMIELADDIDVSVAVCAIGLVKQLLRHVFLTFSFIFIYYLFLLLVVYHLPSGDCLCI